MSQVAFDQPAETRSETRSESRPTSSTGLSVVRDAALGLGGFVLLGAAAGLGSGDPLVAVRAVPSVLAVVVGANLLTGPALLVAHQLARLQAPPEEIVGILVRGVARRGYLAAGLSPAVLFFSITTQHWIAVLVGAGLALAVVGLAAAESRLRQAENAPWIDGSATDADVYASPRVRADLMGLLVGGWVLLTFLVGVRLAFDVARLVLGW